jgi:hypothetical protein
MLSGRPPSINVDEFMARQRERQNPVSAPIPAPSRMHLKEKARTQP